MLETAKERLSDARLDHFLKILDVYGEAFLDLVSDLESVEAIGVMMELRARTAWWETSWLPFDIPSDPFGKPHPVHIQIDKITSGPPRERPGRGAWGSAGRVPLLREVRAESSAESNRPHFPFRIPLNPLKTQ
jgi:hypothetical protein